MLFYSNALAEAFTQHITSSHIPIASEQEIKQALMEVSKINDLYRNDITKQASVLENWHNPLVLDFIAWLSEHIPGADSDILRRKFYREIPLIKQSIRYSAKNAIEDYLEDGLKYAAMNPDTSRIGDVVKHICSMKGDKQVMFINADTWIDALFIPDFSEYFDHYDNLYEYTCENPNQDTATFCVCKTALEYMTSKVALADFGMISVVNFLEDGDVIILVIAMIHGRPIVMAPEIFASMQEIAKDETLAEHHLETFIPHSEFESVASAIVALAISAFLNAVEEAKTYFTEHIKQDMTDEPKTDFRVKIDNGNDLILRSNSIPNIDYTTIYSNLFENDNVNTEIIVDTITMLALEQAAEEIALNGNIENVSNNISELFMHFELGTIIRNKEYSGWKLLDDFYKSIESNKMIKATEDLYDGLEQVEKDKIEAVLKRVIESPDRYNSMLVIDSSFPVAEDGAQAAMLASIPIGTPEHVREDLVSSMRGLATKAYLANEGKMILVSRMNDSREAVEVSFLKWKNHSWSNGRMEELFDIFESSSIGDDLGLVPGDAVIFCEIQPDGSINRKME